jgi:dihydrodipicolinate synthase/N-acetylneuraminate lyase
MLPRPIWKQLNKGVVIPALPLALTADGRFDERHQRALTRYYCDAGAGGIAVAVHTTQFAIRDPKHGLFKPVIELASETIAEWETLNRRKVIRVGGVCGPTAQAVREATILRDAGYHLALLSLAALREESLDQLIAHCRAVAEVMPLMGFYLQPAVGGRVLPREFWRRFAAIENVAAIKVAPFNRYQTLDVVRAVVELGREGEVVLYTGNDDHIVLDLLCEYYIGRGGRRVSIGFAGGLLGHWACWTKSAVELLHDCKKASDRPGGAPYILLVRAAEVTDMNAALFDAANGFRGCIAGIHEVLHRQGLLASTRCLDPNEGLSPGQKEEIDRVCAAYPHLTDDSFVRKNLDRWLA